MNKQSGLSQLPLIGSILAILALSSGVLLTVSQISKRQETRSRAVVEQVQLSFNTSLRGPIPVGYEFPVQILVNTGQYRISAVEFHVSTSLELEITSVVPGQFLSVALAPPTLTSNQATLILGSLPSEPKTGNGILATLILKARQPVGRGELRLLPTTQIAAIGQQGNVVGELPSLQIPIIESEISLTPPVETSPTIESVRPTIFLPSPFPTLSIPPSATPLPNSPR